MYKIFNRIKIWKYHPHFHDCLSVEIYRKICEDEDCDYFLNKCFLEAVQDGNIGNSWTYLLPQTLWLHNPKICMEPKKTPNSQRNILK